MLQYSEVDGHPEHNCGFYQGVWKLLWGTCNQEICVSPVVPVCMHSSFPLLAGLGVIPSLVDEHIHQPFVLNLPVPGRLCMCYLTAHIFLMVFRLWSPLRETVAVRCCGRSSTAAELSAVTEGDGMCVGERKKWPCCVGGELGYSIMLICLTPGMKEAARLWTESRMSVSWLSLSVSRTTVSAVFSSCCSCSAARYTVTALLLSWIYWHSGSRLQCLRKTSKYLRLGF